MTDIKLTTQDYREIIVTVGLNAINAKSARVQEYWLNMQKVVEGQYRRHEAESMVLKSQFSDNIMGDPEVRPTIVDVNWGSTVGSVPPKIARCNIHGRRDGTEMQCMTCGRVWGYDEDKPECEGDL